MAYGAVRYAVLVLGDTEHDAESAAPLTELSGTRGHNSQTYEGLAPRYSLKGSPTANHWSRYSEHFGHPILWQWCRISGILLRILRLTLLELLLF